MARRLPVKILLSAVVAATVVHGIAAAAGEGGRELVNDWLYCAVLCGAAALCLWRAVAVPQDRAAWALIGLGTASWAAAEVYWIVAIAGQRPQPATSLADVGYLLDYPLSIAGVILLVRGRIAGVHRDLALDGAIAGCGAAALGAAVFGPALADLGSGGSPAIVDAAYPIFDVVQLGCLAAGAAIIGWRRGWVVLALGLAIVTLADGLYLYIESSSGYVEGTLLDTTWLAAASLIAVAAWMAPDPRPASEPGPQRAAIAATAAITAVALLLYDHLHRLSDLAVALAGLTLALAIVRLAIVFGDNLRLLSVARRDAITDALTGLGNRRRLIGDLGRATEHARAGHEFVLAIFDLDGFKAYNDSFGHAAGDMLLRRLGTDLAAAVGDRGRAYRLGGDEFCVLAPLLGARPEPIVVAAAAALREDGEAFAITSSQGQALIGADAATPSDALRVADRRLYADKERSSRSFAPQARDLLLGVLREREPGLRAHMESVGERAAELARRLGLDAEEIDVIRRAADLHDVGKVAIPDRILVKPGPLDGPEWELMRTHTLIGERMLSAAPALVPVARLVRSSHERWDGGGYPDGLAGERIPIGARIIAICDAFEAMTEGRPYREPVSAELALAELRAHAGEQFDPDLVAMFAGILAPREPDELAEAGSGPAP